MPLKIGSTNISAVYAGSTKIARIYKGAALVYSSETWASLALENIYRTLIDPGYGNQLIQNGNFNGTTNWSAVNGTISASGNILTYSIASIGSNFASNRIAQNQSALNGHKYLVSVFVKAPYDTDIKVYVHNFYTIGTALANNWTNLSSIISSSSTNGNNNIYFDVYDQNSYQLGDVIQVKEYQKFDLTAIFGAGNEPTSASDPRIKLLKQQKAKALRFDEVYGNGIVMNQLVQNGNFEDGSYWPSSTANVSVTISNNEMTLETLVQGYAQSKEQINNPQYLYADHKYLVSYWAKGSLGSGAEGTSATVIRVSIKLYSYNNSATIFNQDYVGVSSAYRQISSIVQPTQTTSGGAASGGFRVYYQSNTGRSYVGDTVSVKKFNVFDLTLMFGTGNEPTSTDDPRVKKLISEYHPYNVGEYQGTDITSVWTEPYNLCENNFEIGFISQGSDMALAYTARTPSSQAIIVRPNTSYVYSISNSYKYAYVFEYDENMSFIKQAGGTNNTSVSFTTSGATKYVRLVFGTTDNSSIVSIPGQSASQTCLRLDSTKSKYEPCPRINLCDKKSFSQYDYSYDYLAYNANNAVFLQAGTYTFTTGHGVYIQFFNSPSSSDYITVAGAVSYQSVGDATLWNGRGISTVNDAEITLTLKVDCFVTVCGKTNSGPVINPMINAGNVSYPYVHYNDKFIPNYLEGQKSILGVQNVPFTYGANSANITFYPLTDGCFTYGNSHTLLKTVKKVSGHKYFIMLTVDNAVYSWSELGIWDTKTSGYTDRVAPTKIGNDFYSLVTATSSVDDAVPTFQFGGTNNTAMTAERAIILDVTGTPLENQSSHKIYAMLKGIDDLAAGLELHGALEMAQWPHLQLNGAIDAHDSLAITDENYVFTKRVTSVDMSKINWSYQSDHGRFYSNGVQSLIKGNTNGAVVPNISCPKLTSISLNNIDTSDNVTSVYNNMVFFRSTSAGTTSQEAQAFLNGVVLHYELATPQEISIPKEKTAVVDLGSLNWGTVSSTSGTRFYTTSQLVGNANNQSYTAIPNIYCSRYITEDFNHTPSVEGIGTYNSYIYLNSATYSVVADFKAAMSGEYLFYETTYPMLEETEYEASVDLGTLNGYMSNDIYYCADALKPPFAYPTASTANDGYKATIRGYTRAKGNEVAAKTNDKTFCLTSPYLGGNLAIYDSAFAGKTIDEVKAMLSGKKIVFETAAKASTPQHSVMKVDLGSLTWNAASNNYFTATVNEMLLGEINSALNHAYCDHYMVYSNLNRGDYADKGINYGYQGGGFSIRIKDTSITTSDPAVLKSALSGVYLYFDSIVQKARMPNEVKAEYGGVVSTDSEVLPNADISLKF